MLELKKRIQGLISQYPILKRNPLYYEVQRFRQTRPCKVDPSLTDRQDILSTLVKDGVCVVPDAVSREHCQQMIAELEEHLASLAAGTYAGAQTRHKFLDAYRLHDVDKLSPTARDRFYQLPLINDMARAYVSKQVIGYRKEADFKAASIHGNQFLQSELPHFDDWRHRFKAFLYLTDVGEKNAPFTYYTGTHTYSRWNRRYYLEYEMDGPDGRYGHFFPQEMRLLTQRYGFEEKICTGSAGTLIFTDTRGIHRGTTLLEGRRIMLNCTFGIGASSY